MRSFLRSIQRFLSELRRRNVYQVAVTYVLVGVFVIEAADLTLTRLGLPSWTVTLVIVLVGLGFPIALVLAWALEVTPEGVRVEEPEGAEEEVRAPSSSPRDLWVGGSVLALLLLGAWWLWGGLGGGDGADPAESRTLEIEERSIAVLPFEVSGAGAEEWRDGMVTMLSAGLDGAAGLRAIPDRTVFARWEEALGANEGATQDEALEVASMIGARYAVVGSAGVLGEDLRLLADVYETASGQRLGQAEIQGSPDNITALTNELTRKVLGVLLQRSEEAIPSVDLASITTSSLEALKAFLRGERHFRVGRYEAATGDFKAAIREDSTFALAYARLATSKSWAGEPGQDAALRRAHELSTQLPRRERRILRARYIEEVQGRAFEAADSLRKLTEEYPDDPSVWYWLGETLFHGYIPRGWPEAEEALETAVHLDPGAAPYHHHLVEMAFSLHNDSSLAAERIRVHPGEVRQAKYQVIWDLRFGSPSRRKEAWTRLDTLSSVTPFWTFRSLTHPTTLDLWERVLEVLAERENTEWLRSMQSNNALARGRFERAATFLPQTPSFPESSYLAWSLSLGYTWPDSTLRPRLDPARLPPDASARLLQCSGIYLIEQGRTDELSVVLNQLRRRPLGKNPSPGAETQADQALRSLKGYRAYRAGNLQVAEKHWSGFNMSVTPGAVWRGDLYRELGQLGKAEAWYRAGWIYPVAQERLGQLYEEMGRLKKAVVAYERFVTAWEDADPVLQDRVETARQRLDMLTDSLSNVTAATTE